MTRRLLFKNHLSSVTGRVSGALKYLYGIKRYLSENVMSILVNCNVHSIIDYGSDIWAIHTHGQLSPLQDKIDTFITQYFLPAICKKTRRNRKSSKMECNINELRAKCNFLTLEERRDLFLLNYAFLHLYTHEKFGRQGRSSRNW